MVPVCHFLPTFLFLPHFYICTAHAPTGRILREKKKRMSAASAIPQTVGGVFPSSRGVLRFSALLRPRRICASHSAAEDYGQAEAGGNSRLRFPRLCFTTAGKELSHVQWHPGKRNK